MQDTRTLRECLHKAGFASKGVMVFNDKRKNGGRRLKLWGGTHIFDAPVKQQELLEKVLKAEFGTRYKTGYFIRQYMFWYDKDFKSLCIVLQDQA